MILEPVQGEGGFIPMPDDFPAKLRALCDRHGILLDRRRGPVRRRAAPARCGRSSTTTRSPTCSCPASRSAAACRWRRSPAAAEVMDAVDPGGLGGTFGGNPVSCAAANVVLDQLPAMRARVRAARRPAARALDDMATRVETIGEVRGLGPMLALELVRDRETKTPAPERRRRRRREGPRRGPAPARLRPARQRHPPAAAADDHRRRARRAGSRCSKPP